MTRAIPVMLLQEPRAMTLKLEWKEEYAIGDPVIDQEHQKLAPILAERREAHLSV